MHAPVTLKHRCDIQKNCAKGGRRKHFFGRYLVEYMFLKRSRAYTLDPFIEFLRMAGILYNPLSATDTSDDDNSECRQEQDGEDII